MSAPANQSATAVNDKPALKAYKELQDAYDFSMSGSLMVSFPAHLSPCSAAGEHLGASHSNTHCSIYWLRWRMKCVMCGSAIARNRVALGNKMESIGLMPSNTGRTGCKRTGLVDV